MMIKRPPLQLPPEVARDFLADMHAFFAAADSLARDKIAARQLRSLREYQPGKLRLTDVELLFTMMHLELARDHRAGRS
jgi:hypothetical protein